MTTTCTADFRKAKNAALEILNDLGFKTPPINPIDIAVALGTSVFFSDFDGFDKVSGFYDAEDNQIYVNKNELPQRQTFTIAHELGHMVLHKEWAMSQDYKVLLRESLEFPSKDKYEREANTFAANLLVPNFLLRKYVDVASVPELSNLFMVSKTMIQNRIKFEYGEY